MTALTLRRMKPSEAKATRDLIEAAFGPEEDVPGFLDGLRAAGCILGEWVAEEDGVLVGHVVFNRIGLRQDEAERPAVMLTPLAVAPDRQKCGIGTDLTRAALAELEAAGEDLFFVLGHKDYYPRFGFEPVDASRIASRWEQTPYFMIRGAGDPEGRLVLPQVIEEAE